MRCPCADQQGGQGIPPCPCMMPSSLVQPHEPQPLLQHIEEQFKQGPIGENSDQSHPKPEIEAFALLEHRRDLLFQNTLLMDNLTRTSHLHQISHHSSLTRRNICTNGTVACVSRHAPARSPTRRTVGTGSTP